MVDDAGFSVRMKDVLRRKEAIHRPLQGGVPLRPSIALLCIRLDKLQVPLVDVNLSLGPVVPDLEGVEDGIRIPIARGIDGGKVVVHKGGK